MKNIKSNNIYYGGVNDHKKLPFLKVLDNSEMSSIISGLNSRVFHNKQNVQIHHTEVKPEVLIISSYPPRKCGIATFSEDLVKALNFKFRGSLDLKICALEAGLPKYKYPGTVKYTLNTTISPMYQDLAHKINTDNRIKIVLVQHEFGFFHKHEQQFLELIMGINVPVITAFHTVLLNPDDTVRNGVRKIAESSASVVVMTNNSARVLEEVYDIPRDIITVIPHGTHLVTHEDKTILKERHGLAGRKVLSTFGLLGSGKKIETTIEALPSIVKSNPDTIFLIIGKTHPEILRHEGERYRNKLEVMVEQYNLKEHVKFINSYVALPLLLEYLQLTDVYIFTSNDPNQAVSGTFAYAMSCGCPIISTPIPHAMEMLTENNGIVVDYLDSGELAKSVIRLLNDKPLRRNLSLNALQTIVPTSWENSAVAHARLFENISGGDVSIKYNLPEIRLDHMKRMTTNVGIVQFSRINKPDVNTGYTLDDNARALVASCMYFKSTGNKKSLDEINSYLAFIKYCIQPAGNFLNYVDKDMNYTGQNYTANLDDANGRAVWALGYLISLNGVIPSDTIKEALIILEKSLVHFVTIYSPRAIAFAIKGLYYYHRAFDDHAIVDLVKLFANRLAHLYKHETDHEWEWFEGVLTYANSILPEAMLYAWLMTGDNTYKEYSVKTFDFLLSRIFNENGIEVISNRGWLQKGEEAPLYGEQPIDVAYTVMTLSKFYDAFNKKEYLDKMLIAFDWFLGRNRLQQIVYNPVTGGCYDGLEETHVNLNQGAESTLSYLMARITIGKYILPEVLPEVLPKEKKIRVRKKISQNQKKFSFEYKR